MKLNKQKSFSKQNTNTVIKMTPESKIFWDDRGVRKQRQVKSCPVGNNLSYKATIPAGLIILKRRAKGKAKTEKTERFTSCSVSAGGSETWALGPDRTGRPGVECGWCGPMTGTGADGPEGSLRHTWTNTHRSEDRKRRCAEQVTSWQTILGINKTSAAEGRVCADDDQHHS